MTKRKPRGYWMKEENAIAEAKKVMKKHNWDTLPSENQLVRNGYSSLVRAIMKYHKGFPAFRTTLGQTNPGTKPQGYWQKEENTIAEAQQAMQKHRWNTLPPQQELKKHGYHSLSTAISRYHGGIHKFRTKLGQTNNKRPMGYWKKIANVITETSQIMEKHGWNTLPPQKELEKHGYGSLCNAITKYYGGMRTFRTKLGQQNPNTKPPGYWQSLDNTIVEAQKAMSENNWDTLPSQHKLAKHGYGPISTAISLYHGGLIAFRTLLTEHNTGKTQKQQLEELLDEYIAA